LKKIHKIGLLVFAFFQFAALVYAQKLGDTLRINELQVNTLRPLKENTVTIARLDSIVLQIKKSSSLSEVLAEHSGLFIKTYGRGALSTASFRGTDPSHTKVLWNGIELNSPMLGMVDFSLIPMFFIDDVELLPGTSSISQVSGAFGGLVNLRTEPDWENRFSGNFVQDLGSFGSHDEQLRFNIGNSKIQSQTRIFYAHSDNDFSFRNNDIIDSIDLETGRKFHPQMKNEDAWFSYYGMLQEFNYRPTANGIFSMSFWGQKSSRSLPMLSTSESGLNNNINRQEDNSVRAQVSYKHYGDRLKLKLFSGLNYMDLNFNLKNRLSDESYILAINSTGITSSLYNSLDLEYQYSNSLKLQFSTGLDYHKVESLESVKQLGYNKDRTQGRVYGSVYKQWSPKWKSSIKVGSEILSRDEVHPIFKTGTEYHILPDEKLYIKAMISSNSKYPSLNDLYYQPGGNIHLKPERSYDQELGLHLKHIKGKFSFEQEYSLYFSQVNNWIMWYYSVSGFSPENIDRVDIKGFETNLTLSYKAEKTLIKIHSNYALTHSRDMGKSLNEFDYSYGKQLPYIPIHSANTMVFVMRNTWSLTYIWNYYSKRNTTTSNEESSPRDYLYPYFMNQAGLSKLFHLNGFDLSVYLKVNNLFNEEYRSILQRPMPGRNYNLQLNLTF